MTDSEIHFLVQKKDKEKSVIKRTVRTLSVVFIIVPCCLGIIMESITRSNSSPDIVRLREQEEPNLYFYYLFGMFFLLLLVALIGYFSYSRLLKNIIKDIHLGNKTIEETVIIRKQFMGSNNTYHFYLSSTFRLSIEVDKEEYEKYREGDEINIEYTTYSKIYLGYF